MIRAALSLLVVLDVALVTLALLGAPPPLAAVLGVDDPGGAPFAVFRPEVEEDELPLIVRLDASGAPERTARVRSGAEAATRVDERALLLAAKGITRLRERPRGEDGEPGEAGEAREEGVAFEVERFTPTSFPGPVLAAAADGDNALIAGADAAGASWLERFDGVESRTLALPAGLPAPVAAAVVRRLPDRSFHVVLRASHTLAAVHVAGETATLRDRAELPAGSGRIADLGDRLCVLVEHGAVRQGLEIALGPDGDFGAQRPFATFASDALLLGTLPATSGRTLLVRDQHGLWPLRAGASGIEPAPEPPALAPWLLTRPRFQYALLLHLSLLFVAWMVGRNVRRPAPRWVQLPPVAQAVQIAQAAPTVPTAPNASGKAPPAALRGRVLFGAPAGSIRTAPLLQRALALVADAALVAIVWIPVLVLALSPSELEFWLHHALDRDSIEVARLVENSWAVYAILFTLFTTLCDAAFGRTPGKWLLRLQVIELDGAAPSLGSSAARGMFHLLDTLQPLTWPMTIILVLWRRQRLGDLWAGTIVVRRES